MDKIQNYDIVFSGLKEGKHLFQFEIQQAFFQLFETEQEFTNPRIDLEVELLKHSTFLEFELRAKGTIDLVCDISNEVYPYAISPELKVLVKFGEEYDDSNEEVIIIPMNDFAFNIAQLVYEMVMLSVPMKKISPNCMEGNLDEEEYEMEEDHPNEEIDPRWAELLKLKDKNKKK